MPSTTAKRVLAYGVLICGIGLASQMQAAVMQYGDKDVLGTGTYPTDPTTGATLQGLAPGAVTFGAPPLGHGFPFSPDPSDYPGTDQIYVGSVQTASHDGYSQFGGRLPGPQVVNMDYSSLVPAGQSVGTLTLGIAADDFQFPAFGQPYTALVNGIPDAALTNVLNSLNQTGPQVQYFSIGLPTSELLPTNKLTLSINEGGDGGDGWAIDFLTVGVTTVPEPNSGLLIVVGAAACLALGRRLRRA
jgi:hypothetical protein